MSDIEFNEQSQEGAGMSDEIRPADLRIDSFHAGFKSSRFRITHLPTGITVEHPTSREKAYKALVAKLRKEQGK